MPYDYQTERPNLFTEDGVRILTRVRDKAKELLKTSGAFRAQEAMAGCSGSSWIILAALDYLVEMGEIMRVTPPGTWGQYQIFTDTP